MTEEIRLADLPFHLRWMLRRRVAGITQKDLAQALGIDSTVLSAYENGRRLPSDAAAFDRRHQDSVANLAEHRLTLRNVPDTVGEQFVQLMDELSRRTELRLHVTHHQVSEGSSNYMVEIAGPGPEEGRPAARRRRSR